MKLLRKLAFVAVSASLGLLCVTMLRGQSGATEAPAGFDDLTNGFTTQAQFEADRALFEEREDEDEGLGPVYNAQSCAECHQSPVTGGASQITELRAGHLNRAREFVDHAGGSLIQSRAIDASIQETVGEAEDVRSFRTSLNTLGDGFVECIADETLIEISNSQPAKMRGQVIMVPVLEAGGALRVGRFGWKNRHASLVSFSADAYLNEMGITSPLQPTENTSNGRSVADFDDVPDPEDPNGDNVEAFARFVRSTKAPPRDMALGATADAQAGSALFNQIGCNVCHVRTIVTAPAGTVVNGGDFTVPPALGDKTIHPFGDFLLHDVGTGDGIVQNGGPSTAEKIRTAPLWGLRTRSRLMHDGLTVTLTDAILRHAGEAAGAVHRFRALSNEEKRQLLAFLRSL